MKRCPICALENQEVVATRDHGDKTTYRCNRCGKFTISGTAETLAQRSGKLAKLSGWLRERNDLDIEIPMLTTAFISDVIGNLPTYTVSEKQLKLMRALERRTEYPGQDIVILPDQDASIAWAENDKEFAFYIKSLSDRGLIQFSDPKLRTIGDPLYLLHVAPDGWELLEKARNDSSEKSQAFVAMSFDPAMRGIYTDAIARGIEDAGYRPYRVDSTPHLDRIDVKIIAEIRASRFLVADVTQQKAGVYYEAGFAHGLGIPVIWCVREDDLPNVHFDTRQYNHILWREVPELRDKLKNFILATIGRNAT